MFGVFRWIWICIISVCCMGEDEWSEYFPFSTYINTPNTFKLYWKDIESTTGKKSDERIEFGMEVESTGWIAIGISLNGKMTNSDIMLGWIDDMDGSSYLYDMYTKTERIRPFMDDENNLELIYGDQVNNKTRIRFIRPKYPCNDNNDNNEDLPIQIGTTRILYAWNDEDPMDGDISSILQHNNLMGVQSLNLDSGHQTGYDEELLDNELNKILVHDIKMDNHTIHARETTYYCQLFEMPQLNETHHIVKFEPIITPGNEAFVHHIILYHCPQQTVNKSNIGHGDICDQWGQIENMPARACIGLGVTTSLHITYVWAVGMENSVLPKVVGIDLGGLSSSTSLKYGMLEMHYDNPHLIEGIIDHSGFRMYYTPQLRQYSAGIITVGHYFDERHFIPKGLTTVNYGYCMSNCTHSGLPQDGVTIFGSFLHEHPIGTALNLRHIRNGVELEPIDADWAYDFDYQQMVSVDNVKLLPGDDLILECYYTNWRNRTTFGGIRTSTEMCLGLLWVYPKPKLATCVTSFTANDLSEWELNAKSNGYLNNDATVVDYNDNTPFNYDIKMDGAIKYYNNLWHNDQDIFKQRYLMCFDQNGDTIWNDGSVYTDHIDGIPEYRLNFEMLEKEELCYDTTLDQENQDNVLSIYKTNYFILLAIFAFYIAVCY